MQAIEQLLQQAVTHHEAGELAEAESCYRRILQADPRHSKANHNLGALFVQQGHAAEALPFFIAALEADPAHGQNWLSYIHALHHAGRPEEARQVLALARQGGLQGGEVDVLEGQLAGDGLSTRSPAEEMTDVLVALFGQGRYDEAEVLARKMTGQFPGHWAGWKMLGVLLNRKGASAEALDPMQQAVALLPGDAESRNNLGIVLQALQRFDEAEASYRHALQINPGFPQAHNNLGSCLQAAGRLEQAATCYRQALHLDPGYVRAHINLGEALYAQGKHGEAEAALRSLLLINPAHAEAYLKLGNVLFDSGRRDEAEASYRTALRLRPDFAEANNNLAVILQAKKLYREAEGYSREALRWKPDFADAYSNLAVILEATKRHVEAEACCREAIRLKPDFAGAWCNLGAALQSQGRLQEAEACLLQALEFRPDFVEVQTDLGYLYCVLDQLDKAAAAFQRALELDQDGYGLEAAVYLAVLSYLDGDLERSRALLDVSSNVLERTDERFRHARGYWGYLDRLLALSSQASRVSPQFGFQTLYVVGESHCLSANGIDVRHKEQAMRCKSEWIWGCKQWHLGSGTNNKFRQKFDAVMARLPRESKILLLIGEIDCRYDEGILKAWEKTPDKALSEVARATVDAYVDYVMAAARLYGHTIILGGVPAPNIELEALPPETASRVVSLIGSVNAALKDRASSAGMAFLDVYALTDRGDGIADGQWHIDQHHLFPGAIVEAVERFCH